MLTLKLSVLKLGGAIGFDTAVNSEKKESVGIRAKICDMRIRHYGKYNLKFSEMRDLEDTRISIDFQEMTQKT